MDNKTKTGWKSPLPRSHFQEIGRKGGLAGRNNQNKGFGATKRDKNGLTGPERAKLAGYKGGRLSRRGVVKKK